MKQPPSTTRLGIFGGSFDPVHFGHLQLARSAAEQAELEEVWLVPTAIQPHKRHGPVASNEDRLAMLAAALADEPGLVVSDREIARGGVSYTVDTLRAIQEESPDAELFLLMGADTLHDLPLWHEPAEVLRLATPMVVQRPGEPPADFQKLSELADADRIQSIRQQQIKMPAMAVSSSEIRRRVSVGEPIVEFVPQEVASYIAQQGLYR